MFFGTGVKRLFLLLDKIMHMPTHIILTKLPLPLLLRNLAGHILDRGSVLVV